MAAVNVAVARRALGASRKCRTATSSTQTGSARSTRLVRTGSVTIAAASRRVPDRPGEEGAVAPGELRELRVRGQQPGRLVAVGREVDRAPEQVIVDARDVRPGRVRRRNRLL